MIPTVPRLRGRALQRRRAALFAISPWCVRCLNEGRQTKATIRSHPIPLDEGGADDETNEEAICLDCNDAKHAIESARGLRVHRGQDTFRKSAAPRDQRGQFRVRPTTVRGRRELHPDVPPERKR